MTSSAEQLIRTLPGVVSARIVSAEDGGVREVHVLTTTEVPAKQTVRNIESALIAHLGMKVDHRKISVAATTSDPKRITPAQPVLSLVEDPREGGPGGAGERSPAAPSPVTRRRVYFEDIEVRGSRTKGVSCRVTLSKDGEPFVGEAQGLDGERSRLELAARATLFAIGDADGRSRQFALEGVRVIEAFERVFVFCGVTVRSGRDMRLLTGTCEVTDGADTAAVLAVLDATNRWIEFDQDFVSR